MKKFLRNAVIAATLWGAAFGAVSSADAFIYGLYNNTAPGEITQLGDGINLCYEHQCNSVFVDENSAYIVSQDGPHVCSSKEWEALSAEPPNTGILRC